MQAPSVRIATAVAEVALDSAPLTVTALSIDAGSQRLLLVSADIIWFSAAMTERLRPAIAKRAGIEEACVILAASHTHGSPQPDARFPFGRHDPDWVARFQQAVLDTAAQAACAPATGVALSLGDERLAMPVSVNRRRMAWYRDGARIFRRVQNLPNDARPVDDRVRALVARDAERRVRALVVHASCHPVALPRDMAGADFPDVMRARLTRLLGADVPILFLQGHCGDVRPRLIRRPNGLRDQAIELLIGPRFRASRDGDAEWIGHAVADAAAHAVERARPLKTDLAAAHGRISLKDDAGTPVGRDLDITAWRLAPDLQIVAASGEMLSGLASPDPGLLSVGYANGMAGYIAPASEYARGGYEIDGFLKSFGLNRRFSPETEQRFLAERARLLAALGSPEASSAEASAA